MTYQRRSKIFQHLVQGCQGEELCRQLEENRRQGRGRGTRILPALGLCTWVAADPARVVVSAWLLELRDGLAVLWCTSSAGTDLMGPFLLLSLLPCHLPPPPPTQAHRLLGIGLCLPQQSVIGKCIYRSPWSTSSLTNTQLGLALPLKTSYGKEAILVPPLSQHPGWVPPCPALARFLESIQNR